MISPIRSVIVSNLQKLRIQVVNGGICECCGETGDPRRLQIQPIPGADLNPEKRILILCPQCERRVRDHEVAPNVMNMWVERRDFRYRMLLRKILGFHPSPYLPPPSSDLEEMYRLACTGWCLNGSG